MKVEPPSGTSPIRANAEVNVAPDFGQPHVAGQGEIEPEPGGGAPQLGHDRQGTADDGEHRRLKVG